MLEGRMDRMSAASNLLRHRGVRAGVAALAAGGMVVGAGVAGVAGAAQDTTIAAVGDATEGQWDKREVTMQTGDTVTFAFPGAGHNVGAINTSEKDPRWKANNEPGGWFEPGPTRFDAAQVGTRYDFTFYKSGTYDYICVLHPNMTGTITVTGADQEIPTGPPPTPTPTPTPPPVVPTPTPVPDPTGPTPTDPNPELEPAPGSNVVTPAPSPDEADTRSPRVSAVSANGKRRLIQVRFRLAEDATVAIQVRKRGSRRAVRTVRVQANAGRRTIKVRSNLIRKGQRYVVQVNARDAMGNRFAADAETVRIGR